jgi:hypothetical protein
MNTKTKRLKQQKRIKESCSCLSDYSSRTIYVCDYCHNKFDLPKVIHIKSEDRIGRNDY